MQQRSKIDNKRKRETQRIMAYQHTVVAAQNSVHSNTAHTEEPNWSAASVPCTGIGPPTILSLCPGFSPSF